MVAELNPQMQVYLFIWIVFTYLNLVGWFSIMHKIVGIDVLEEVSCPHPHKGVPEKVKVRKVMVFNPRMKNIHSIFVEHINFRKYRIEVSSDPFMKKCIFVYSLSLIIVNGIILMCVSSGCCSSATLPTNNGTSFSMEKEIDFEAYFCLPVPTCESVGLHWMVDKYSPGTETAK